MVVAETLEYTQARRAVNSLDFREKGDLLHGVSATSTKPMCHKMLEKCVRKLRLTRVAARFLKEREKGPTLVIQQGGQSGRSPECLCRMSNSEVVQIVMKQTWKNKYKVKGTYIQACEQSSDHQQNNSREKWSHLGQACNHENPQWRTSPHDMSEPTSSW